MIDTIKRAFTQQYEASLQTIRICIDECPDANWQAPVARYPFSQVVYHTLFFADYYLGVDAESFRVQPYHAQHPDLFGDYEQIQDREPTSTYEREQVRSYLDHCRDKAVSAVAAENEASLSGPSGFARRDFSRCELHVYNIRHIQHHAAQLTLRLRLDDGPGIPWVGSGWSLS